MKKLKLIALWLGLMGLIASLILSARASSQEHKGQTWAICAGINDYMKNVTPLDCAINDAREINTALVKSGGFKQGNTVLLTTDQRESNIPTKVNIARWISTVREHAGPDDTVIFSFSGHGIQMDDEGYLLTFEADPLSEETLEASCLKVSDLRKWLSRMKAARVIIFMDACREDPRGGLSMNRLVSEREIARGARGIELAEDPKKTPPGKKDNPLTDKFARGFTLSIPADSGTSSGHRLSATFFSCDVNQRSYEWAEYGMGFFSYFLVKGLRGAAVDGTGNVTLKSLNGYVCPQVAGNVEKERKTRQNPRVFLQGGQEVNEWIVASKETLAAAGGPKVAYEPPYSGATSTPRAVGDRSLALAVRKKQGEKITYTLDIISNRVKSRSYDELAHEIVENFYEADRDALRRDVAAALDGSPLLAQASKSDEADLWIFFNICPTEDMSVDIFARDRRNGATVSKQNARMNRPYPGNSSDLIESALRTLKNRFMGPLEKSMKEHYDGN
jgi:hypothetical protein